MSVFPARNKRLRRGEAVPDRRSYGRHCPDTSVVCLKYVIVVYRNHAKSSDYSTKRNIENQKSIRVQTPVKWRGKKI